MTAFYGIFDPPVRQFRYCSAGHNPPRLRSACGSQVTTLDAAQSLPLGVFEDEEYGDCSIQLRPRQNLLFYTDGITEARSPQGEQFGPARLDAVCTDCAGDPINFFRRLSRPLKPSPSRPP